MHLCILSIQAKPVFSEASWPFHGHEQACRCVLQHFICVFQSTSAPSKKHHDELRSPQVSLHLSLLVFPTLVSSLATLCRIPPRMMTACARWLGEASLVLLLVAMPFVTTSDARSY